MKPILNGDYWVHEEGRVYKSKEGKLKPVFACHGSQGYKVVKIYNKMKYLHHVVALAFLGITPEGCHIHHKDGDKANNKADNLVFISKKIHGDINGQFAKDMPPTGQRRKLRRHYDLYGDEPVKELMFT